MKLINTGVLSALTILWLLALPVSIQAAKPSSTQDYRNMESLLRDFLKPDTKPKASFDYWIEQLGHHIDDRSFESFAQDLKRALKRARPKRVLDVFKQHRAIFDRPAQDYLLKMGLEKVKKAFEERLQTTQEAQVSAVKDSRHLLKAIRDSLDRMKQIPQTEELTRMQNAWCAHLITLVAAGELCTEPQLSPKIFLYMFKHLKKIRPLVRILVSKGA